MILWEINQKRKAVKKYVWKVKFLEFQSAPWKASSLWRFWEGAWNRAEKWREKALFNYLNSFGKDMLTFICSSPFFFLRKRQKWQALVPCKLTSANCLSPDEFLLALCNVKGLEKHPKFSTTNFAWLRGVARTLGGAVLSFHVLCYDKDCKHSLLALPSSCSILHAGAGVLIPLPGPAVVSFPSPRSWERSRGAGWSITSHSWAGCSSAVQIGHFLPWRGIGLDLEHNSCVFQ